jgi:stage IV sporulation protein FB
MHRNVPLIQQDASFDHAFLKMQECRFPGLGVVNRAGTLVGLITPEAIGEMMMIFSLTSRGLTPSWRQDKTTVA